MFCQDGLFYALGNGATGCLWVSRGYGELCFGDEVVASGLDQLLSHHGEHLRRQFLVL